MEAIVVLLFLLVAAAPVVVAALAVVAYLRSNRIAEILDRLERIDRHIGRLAAPSLERHERRPEQRDTPHRVGAESVPVAVAVPDAEVAVPKVLVVEEVAPVKSILAYEVKELPTEPAPQVRSNAPQMSPTPASTILPPLARPQPSDAALVEWWIGNRIGWLAVVVFVFAAAFFLKYAFDNNWITEWGRVCIGLTIGAALCAGGFAFHRKNGRVLRDVCTAAGVATLYLSAYSTFGFFNPPLLTPDHGGNLLTAAIALATVSAVLYDSAPIALLTLIGGLLTPVLLASPVDRYVSFFLYLSCLAAAEVCVTLWRPWPAVRTVALLGVHGLYWLWFAAQYHPEKRSAAALFIAVVYALFFAHALLTARHRRATGEDLALVVLNPALLFAAAYLLLGVDYHVWGGALALAVAVACAAGAACVVRWRADDAPQRFLWIAVGLFFLTLAVPLQIGVMEIGLVWIAPCWALMGLALWWHGLRNASRPYQVFGAILLLFALGRLLTAEDFYVAPGRFIPLLNAYTTAGALTTACLFGAALVARRYSDRLGEENRSIHYGAALIGFMLIWLLLSRELYDFCTQIIYPSAEPWGSAQGQRASETAFPVAWAAMGLALWWFGLRGAARPYRVFAVLIFVGALLRLLTAQDFIATPGQFVPVGNSFTVAGVLTGARLFGIVFAARRYSGRMEEGDRGVRYAAGLIGVALVWLLLSREIYFFCTQMAYPSAEPWGSLQGRRLAQTALPPLWAVMGLALWWYGLRFQSWPYRLFGAVLLVAALIRLLTADDFFVREVPFVPFFNGFAIAAVLTAAALLGAAFTARYYAARLEEGDVIVRYGAGLIAVGLIWLLLSREVYDYCTLVWGKADERLAQAALSVTWTAYAALLLWIGFALRHALTRWAALVVFAVTVAKVFLYDLSGLDGLFRILAFFVLALVLAAAAWGYQKFQAYFQTGTAGQTPP